MGLPLHTHVNITERDVPFGLEALYRGKIFARLVYLYTRMRTLQSDALRSVRIRGFVFCHLQDGFTSTHA
jgi:hypothetical protein